MNVNLPINRWTVAVALTALAWLWLARWTNENGGGDYNFGPAIMGMIVLAATVALWAGLLLGALL